MKPDMGKGLLILAALKKKHDAEGDKEEKGGDEPASHDEEIKQVAEQLIQGVKDEDVEAVVNALHMAYSLCKEQNEMEEPESEDEQENY